ncbi:MAG: GNAT family N-acetyltransferase [Thermoplasmata archaeon]
MGTPADVEIRRLDPDRLDELVEVQNDIFSDYIVPMRSSRQFFLDFQKSVGGDLEDVLVAVSGDRIVGYANPVIDGQEAWIGGVGVVPGMRGKGIGKMLMLEAESFCRDRGVRELYLEVIEGNTRAQMLYERLGYVETRRFVTAEGRPTRFEGFGEPPRKAGLEEIVRLHQRSYAATCWQRRKVEALVHAARSAECYATDGGFVLVRSIDTNGFIPFLGVVPEKRGRGIGTVLARFALTRLWTLGAFKVGVYNVNEDAPTLRMLDKFDFKVTMRQIEMMKTL